MMRYVFVSHADLDKPALKTTLERLLAAGLPLWIDRPASSVSLRIAWFCRALTGADWDYEIRTAYRGRGMRIVLSVAQLQQSAALGLAFSRVRLRQRQQQARHSQARRHRPRRNERPDADQTGGRPLRARSRSFAELECLVQRCEVSYCVKASGRHRTRREPRSG